MDGTVAASTTAGVESVTTAASGSESGSGGDVASSMVTPTPTVTGIGAGGSGSESGNGSGVSDGSQASESAPLSSGAAGMVGTEAWKVGVGMAVLGLGVGL